MWCMWKPSDDHSLAHRTVYVTRDWRLSNHFGTQECNYCHWLDNVPPIGPHQAWKVLLQHPGLANPQKRDASALRLLSWLSFSLDDRTSALLSRLMKQLASDLLENSSAILQIVHESEIGAAWHNLAETRMGLIDRVTVSNLAQPSAVINQLYRTFLTRLSFPRLVHFLDLVLPHMVPHQRIREQNQIRHLTSHWLSLLAQERKHFAHF